MREAYIRWIEDSWKKKKKEKEGKNIVLRWIHICSDYRWNKVNRRSGEGYAQCTIVGTIQYGGDSAMVWGGINMETRMTLVRTEGGL